MGLDHLAGNGQPVAEAAAEFDEGRQLRWRDAPQLLDAIVAADGHPDHRLIPAGVTVDRDTEFVARDQLTPVGEQQ